MFLELRNATPWLSNGVTNPLSFNEILSFAIMREVVNMEFFSKAIRAMDEIYISHFLKKVKRPRGKNAS